MVKRFSVPCFLIYIAAFLGAQSADQLFSGARGAFSDELWSVAASGFSRLLREYPEDPRADSAAYMEAMAYYRDGRMERAARAFNEFESSYPDSPWRQRTAYWKGRVYFGIRNWNGAVAAFRRQSALGESDYYFEDTLMRLAAALNALKLHDDAAEAYRTLISANRGYQITATALNALGRTRLEAAKNGDPDRARDALEAFRRLAYDYTSSNQARYADYWIAVSLAVLGRNEEALYGLRDFLTSYYERSSLRADALLRAASLAHEAGFHDEALAYLDLREEEGWAPEGEDGVAILWLQAASAMNIGDLPAARKAYSALVNLGGSLEDVRRASFNLGQTWIGTDQEELALEPLLRAAGGRPSALGADALYSAGTVALRAERQEEGAEILEKLSRTYPEDSRREEALRLAVRARRESGNDAAVMENLDELIRDYPRSGRMPVYLFARAQERLAAGDEPGALEDFGRVTTDFSSHDYAGESASRIGFIYGVRGEYARAAEYYDRAVPLLRNAPDESRRRVLYSAGAAYLNAGDPDAAAQRFTILVDEAPAGEWGDDAAFYLGEALYDQGRFVRARQAYEMVALTADSPWLFDAAYGTGWSYFREEAWTQASEAFRAAAALAEAPADKARSLLRAGLSKAGDGGWESAINLYALALKQGYGDWREEALYQQAWAQLQLNLREEARDTADVLASEFPSSRLPADLPFRMGEAALAAGDYMAAVEWFDECLTRYPESEMAPRAELRAALGLFEAGDAASAAERYGRWAAAYTGSGSLPGVMRSWADALKAAGDPDAVQAAREFAEDLPASSAAPVVLAWVRMTGLPEVSAEILESYAKDESLQAADRTESLLLRAHLFRKAGEMRRARQVYEVLVRDVPGRPGAEAQMGRALSYEEEGKVDLAIEAYLNVSYSYPRQADFAAEALRAAERLLTEAGREAEAVRVRERLEASSD